MRWPSKRLGTFWRPATTRTTMFFCLFVFRRIIFPGKGAKYGLFWGDCFFCSRWPMKGNELRRKKKFQLKKLRKNKKPTKKTSKISKKSSPRASDTGKGSYKHNAPDLWDRVFIGSHTLNSPPLNSPISKQSLSHTASLCRASTSLI